MPSPSSSNRLHAAPPAAQECPAVVVVPTENEEQQGHGCVSHEKESSFSSAGPNEEDEETGRRHTLDIHEDPSRTHAISNQQQPWEDNYQLDREPSVVQQDENYDQVCHGDDGGIHARHLDNFNLPQSSSLGSSYLDADHVNGLVMTNSKQGDDVEEGVGDCCRVCQLTVERTVGTDEVIKLGCACKRDLAMAHRHCAETWFKIKGDRTCEICGSTAGNILGSGNSSFMENWNDPQVRSTVPVRAERCWQNQPLCNTLLVCFILLLVASWLFRLTLF